MKSQAGYLRQVHFAFFVLFNLSAVISLSGCGMNNDLISDMDSSYEIAVKERSVTADDRSKKITLAVEKYFPNGMKKEAAFELLRKLKTEGFDIREYRHENGRQWPDGEFKNYATSTDEATKRSLQNMYPIGQSTFVLLRTYGFPMPLFEKSLSITFNLPDKSNEIQNVRGAVWVSGL